MQLETGYHKLSDPLHWDSIRQTQTFYPSVPAERHWLGEGIYFFMDPNGIKWAVKWPHSPPRAGSKDGIVLASIDVSDALDFRDPTAMAALRDAVSRVRGSITRKYKTFSDGAALAFLFKANMLRHPSCLIANFDRALGEELWLGSRFILKPQYCLPPYSETTQIQVCVREHKIIHSLSLYTEFSAM